MEAPVFSMLAFNQKKLLWAAMDTPPEDVSASAVRRFNPWLFFGFLLAPGLFSAITLMNDQSDYRAMSFVVLAIVSVISGLVCGVHFAMIQRQLSPGVRIVVGIVSVIGCAGAAVALGLGGCYLLAVAGILK